MKKLVPLLDIGSMRIRGDSLPRLRGQLRVCLMQTCAMRSGAVFLGSSLQNNPVHRLQWICRIAVLIEHSRPRQRSHFEIF
ncbi:MAG: hypothetical protein ACLQHK_13090 [Gallionellaceae bacterium]